MVLLCWRCFAVVAAAAAAADQSVVVVAAVGVKRIDSVK